ncbi:MAG: AI-2E family transporter [Pseudomonadota bacterium]
MPSKGDGRARHPLAIPITGIFVLLLIHALIAGSAFLLPVTTALLGYFLLNAPRRGLQRLGVTPPASAALFTILIATFLVVVGVVAAEPIYDFVADLPGLVEQAIAQLTGPGGPLEALTRAAAATEEAMASTGDDQPLQVEVVGDGGLATSVVALAPSLLSQIIFALCLLFFLTASGDMFIQKVVQVVDRFEDKRTTVQTIRTIEARLGAYLGAITLINAGLGVCIGLAMWVWGLPSPWLIGIMAGVLNFIPFVGAVIGAGIAGIIGFIGLEDPWIGLGVLVTYYVLTSIEGQLVTPALLGQRLRLNVTMVFLSVAFFAWIWSAMGMVVAVPMLIVAKVICDAVPKLRKVGLFLGDASGFVPTDGERKAVGASS